MKTTSRREIFTHPFPMSAPGSEPTDASITAAVAVNAVKNKQGSNDLCSVLATIWYLFAFLVLGIPVWWKTTEVYRAAVPFEEIRSLRESNVTQLIHVKVILDDDSINIDELLTQVVQANANREANNLNSHLKFKYSWTAERADTAVQDIVENSKCLASLDENFKSVLDSAIADIVVVVSRKFLAHPQLIIGAYRAVYIPSKDKDIISLSRSLVSSIVYNVVREDVFREFTQPFSSEKRMKPTKSHQRALQASPFIDVIVTTVVPGPEEVEVTWNSKLGFESYVKPFLNKVQQVVQLKFKSQFKFGSSVDLIIEKNTVEKEFYIRHNKLSTLINQFEKIIPGQVSLNPTLNFLTYVVPKNLSPLYIVDENGKKLESNAFLSPRWGGILFYNVHSEDDPQPKVEIDNQIIYQVFLSQLRPLLGVPDRNTDKEFDTHHRRDASAVTDWEVDFLMRRKTLEYLTSATKRLHSLSALLNKISNMVINDNISQLTFTSVASGKNALRLLAQGHLDSALSSAEDAFSASEKAFFDPSLLGLLYFPDDQKYAIYVPLFVPTLVPVIHSLSSIVCYLKSLLVDSKVKIE